MKPDPSTAKFKLWVLWDPDKAKAKAETGTFYSYDREKDPLSGLHKLMQMAERMRKDGQWKEAVIYHNTGTKEWLVRLYPDGQKDYRHEPATLQVD